ncbi:hypothetical protein [Pseudoduganella chitinolytica]|uniref:Uncharacterized protein n=1 Tax=Pseudoduganella chitinolytica TaxID=34070 RepID=A0ABY8BH07_9BURK|nr:hypothetical protein [Pseudoduganella chitinolytica]WEF34236.1 hypothetical protein PX653_05555 [Pseudoduganella chitinolytica]
MGDTKRGGWAQRSNLAVLALALCGAHAASAGDSLYSDKKLCGPDKYVDKEALAKLLVEHHRIGSTFRKATGQADGTSNAPLLAALMRMGDTPCDKMGGACDADEKRDSTRLMTQITLLFSNPQPEFSLPAGSSKADFFLTPDQVNPLLCTTRDTDRQTAEAVESSAGVAMRLRLRGHPDELVIRRDTREFRASTPADFSIERDEVGHSRTVSSNAYVGFVGQEQVTNLTRTAWIGYLGMARRSTRVDGEDARDRKLNQLHAGLIYEQHEVGNHRLTFRPTYFQDRVDGTRVVAASVEYTPYWPRKEEGRYVTNLLINFDAFAIRPVVKGKLKLGHFTSRSRDPDTAAHQENFLRAGGVLGVDIVGRDVPVEYHFSYTGLAKVRGPSSINHIAHALSLSLDPNNYASLLLAYVRGTNEETLLREKQWKLTFALRY